MLIVSTTNGTRGDVQPHVALGAWMRRELGVGYRVCAPERYRAMVVAHGLEFCPTRTDLSDFVQEFARPGGKVWPVLMYRARKRLKEPGRGIEEMFEDFEAGCRGADVVVYDALSYPGRKVAQALGARPVGCAMQPMFYPTGEYGSSVIPSLRTPLARLGRLQAAYNRLSYVGARAVFWATTRDLVNDGCKKLGLGPEPIFGVYDSVASSGEPWLNAWSETILPAAPEWPPRMHTTGYWFLDAPEGWEPPAELVDFLEAGEAPVCVGFGSMRRGRKDYGEIVVRALREAGARGVLLGGEGAIRSAARSRDVVWLKEAPHDWLFPRCAAVVHHGGAGTVGAALRAGIPMIVVGHMADQAFWADKARRLGVAAEPMSPQALSAGRLGRVLDTTLSDGRMAQRAAEVGGRVRRENGAAVAGGIIRRHCAR